MTRSSILRGPAIVTYGGSTFYSKDDIALDLTTDTFDIATSLHGKVDERVISRALKVRFTPSGEWEALGVLWPYGSALIGSSVFGAGSPLVIQTRSGTKLTLYDAAVTSMPDIELATSRTLIGPVEFTCIGKDDEAWETAESLVKVEANAWSDTTFSSSSIKTQAYSASWGVASPWSSFVSMSGFRVSFDLRLSPIETDPAGLVDMTIADLGVRCRCVPMNVTESDLVTALKIQGSTNGRGRSLNAGANNLVISATGVSVTLRGAQMRSGQMTFGTTTPRIGEVEFVSTRTFAAGVAEALFSLA